MIGFRQNIGHVLGRMTWCMPRHNNRFAECETIAVFHFLLFELVFRAAFVTDVNFCRIGSRAEFARTAHQVRVNVRFENVRDRYFRLAGHVDVDIHVRSRVKDRGDAFVIIAQQIGKLSDPFGLDRFKNE